MTRFLISASLIVAMASHAVADDKPQPGKVAFTVVNMRPGTVVWDGDDSWKVVVPMYALTRSDFARVIATINAGTQAKNQLFNCIKKQEKPVTGRYTALKWAGIGAAVVGAFAVGLALR